MPLISLTQDAMDRGKTPETGWSTLILDACRENKAKETNSINYFFEFECESGPENKEDNKGRYVTFMINSAGMDKGLGTEDYVRMVAALQGILPKEVAPADHDTDKMIGLKCWGKIEIITRDSKPRAVITDFCRLADQPF